VQQHPLRAQIVAVEQVRETTRVRIGNFGQPLTDTCMQELASHLAYVAKRYVDDHCVSRRDNDDEVSENDVQMTDEDDCVTVNFHCRAGENH